MGNTLDKLRKTNGKKTYTLIIATIGYAVSATIVGEMEVSTAISCVVGSLFAGTLRHGMSTTLEGLIQSTIEDFLTDSMVKAKTEDDLQAVNR